MDLCAYVTWFGLFSVIGWLYECTYCAIKTKKWDNRGFLFGPVCPIYGFGGIMVIAAANLVESAVPSGGTAPEPWQVFVVSALGSAVLEYVTSYVLERWFHARWWDYSNVPLNLNGRICLPFTLCFGLAGMAVYYYASAAVADASATVPLIFWEVAALVTVGLMSADLALTNAALSDLDDRIEEAQADFDAVMDVAVEDMASGRMPLGDDIRAHTRRLAGGMGRRSRKVLSKMRTFSTDARAAVARGLREAIEGERQELESLEDGRPNEHTEEREQPEQDEQSESLPEGRP